MFKKNIFNIKTNSIQIDYGILQHFYENEKLNNKSYIFHLAGRSNDIRNQSSKNYLNKITGVFNV